MENRIRPFNDDRTDQEGTARRMDEVLAELFAQYQTRFPNIQIAVVETPETAA